MPRIESRRSNLKCVPYQEPGRPIQIDQLRRVRKPVSRSKSGVQGKVADVIHGRSRHAESQNELKAFQILVATAHADSWQEQPFTLEYHHEGAKHRYTPDILVSNSGNRLRKLPEATLALMDEFLDADYETLKQKRKFAVYAALARTCEDRGVTARTL